MNTKHDVVKRNRQKLESLINKGGIKTEHQEHGNTITKPTKNVAETHVPLKRHNSYHIPNRLSLMQDEKFNSQNLIKNEDKIAPGRYENMYIADYDQPNNETYYSKELVQVKEESSESSSGDEKISRAFGIERSLTMTPKVKSYQCSSSFGAENPEIEQSMLTDELKMLSFLNEEDDDLDAQFQAQKNKINSRLQKNYLVNKNQTMTLKNFDLNPSKFINSHRKRETSMFSTQDSKKQFSNSFTQKHNSFNNHNHSAHIVERDDEIPIHELNSETKNRLRQDSDATANLEPKFSQCNNEVQPHMEDHNFNMYCSTMQHESKFFYNYYVPNPELRFLPQLHKTDNSDSYGDISYGVEDQSNKSKKGKRNYLKVEDSNEFIINTTRIESVRKTTLMIRNIPNKYTKELMLETIDANFDDAYDFFYLPIDFKNNCNVGYAFINFKELKHIKPFFEQFNNKKWAKFNSEKVCEIKYARIQGKAECEAHFKDSSLMKQPVS